LVTPQQAVGEDWVKGLFLSLGATGVLLGLCSCGGGDGRGPDQIVTQIESDPAYDGDIEQTDPGVYVVTQGMSSNVQTVFAGIDPSTGDEFRSFLDFPLGGPHGVPNDAIIDSAYLEVYVDGIEPPTGSIPMRVELVAFQPPNLIGTDFDRNIQPSLGAVVVQGDVNNADINHFVQVDVTPLMITAQRQGLVDFQVRVMEDLGPAIETLVQIDDNTTSNRSARSPLLTVTYH
jgi:hypothetical protein